MDQFKNKSVGTLAAGIDNDDVTMNLVAGHGARFPAVPFNGWIWDTTVYPRAEDDPDYEIVRVTDIDGDELTIVRAQEGTAAASHNTIGRGYAFVAGLTAKTLNDDLGVPFVLNNSGIDNVSTDALVLENTEAAVDGAQQWSPRVRWVGQGFGGSTSQTVEWLAEVIPVQGATNPTSFLRFGSRVNGATAVGALFLDSRGRLGNTSASAFPLDWIHLFANVVGLQNVERIWVAAHGTRTVNDRVHGQQIVLNDDANVVNKTVTNAANNGSGLIRLTTSTAHGFTTGDYVAVYGVVGTVEANAWWQVTVINSTTIDLQGSTFTNAYTSGGVVTNRPALYGQFVVAVPTVSRGELGGTASNGDDIGCFVAYNGSANDSLAGDVLYVGHNDGFSSTQPEWFTVVSSDANVHWGVTIRGNVLTGGVDLAEAALGAGAYAFRMGNTHPFKARNAANSADLILFALNSSNILEFSQASQFSDLGVGASPSGSGAKLFVSATTTAAKFTASSATATFVAIDNTGGGNTNLLFSESGVGRWYIGNGASDDRFRFLNSDGNGNAELFALFQTGLPAFQGTITAGGTTGARTINKPRGTVNFAASAASLVVTNSLVTTSSIIHCTVGTNDATMKSAQAVAGAGSFTIFPNAVPTAETRVNFSVEAVI